MCQSRRPHVRLKNCKPIEQVLIQQLCNAGLDTDSAILVRSYCVLESYRIRYPQYRPLLKDGEKVILEAIALTGILFFIFALVSKHVAWWILFAIVIGIPGGLVLLNEYMRERYYTKVKQVHWRLADLRGQYLHHYLYYCRNYQTDRVDDDVI
jgi:hypothetical protein